MGAQKGGDVCWFVDSFSGHFRTSFSALSTPIFAAKIVFSTFLAVSIYEQNCVFSCLIGSLQNGASLFYVCTIFERETMLQICTDENFRSL